MAEPFSLARAHELLAKQRFGTLSTLMPDGSPYGSLVAYAVSEDGANPLLLISKLAWHTRNLEADARACLLISDSNAADPVAGARLSILGSFHKIAAEKARARFLGVHETARLYADFADFGFWQMQPEQVHVVGGFGLIQTFSSVEWQA